MTEQPRESWDCIDPYTNAHTLDSEYMQDEERAGHLDGLMAADEDRPTVIPVWCPPVSVIVRESPDRMTHRAAVLVNNVEVWHTTQSSYAAAARLAEAEAAKAREQLDIAQRTRHAEPLPDERARLRNRQYADEEGQELPVDEYHAGYRAGWLDSIQDYEYAFGPDDLRAAAQAREDDAAQWITA